MCVRDAFPSPRCLCSTSTWSNSAFQELDHPIALRYHVIQLPPPQSLRIRLDLCIDQQPSAVTAPPIRRGGAPFCPQGGPLLSLTSTRLFPLHEKLPLLHLLLLKSTLLPLKVFQPTVHLRVICRSLSIFTLGLVPKVSKEAHEDTTP